MHMCNFSLDFCRLSHRWNFGVAYFAIKNIIVPFLYERILGLNIHPSIVLQIGRRLRILLPPLQSIFFLMHWRRLSESGLIKLEGAVFFVLPALLRFWGFRAFGQELLVSRLLRLIILVDEWEFLPVLLRHVVGFQSLRDAVRRGRPAFLISHRIEPRAYTPFLAELAVTLS